MAEMVALSPPWSVRVWNPAGDDSEAAVALAIRHEDDGSSRVLVAFKYRSVSEGRLLSWQSASAVTFEELLS